MKKVLVGVLVSMLLATSVMAAPVDITVTVDVDKIAAVIPIPEARDPKTMSNETMPLYDTNKEWVEAIIIDYLRAQERRFRAAEKAKIANQAELVDETVAVIKK